MATIGLLTLQSCEEDKNEGINGGAEDVDIEWIEVEGGTFEMGCREEKSNCNDSETPLHTVTLSGFSISKYEITNAQYVEFLNDINCNSDGSYNDDEYGKVDYIVVDCANCQINYSDGHFVAESGKNNYPVIFVTWYGANAFAQWAGGRLPTEAEWEFAARGGNQSQGYEYSGSGNLDEVGWYGANSDEEGNSGLDQGHGTFPVGQKQPNELGIYDMSGNVGEWCYDWFDETYYSNSPENNPQGPSSGTYRVNRGGAWNSNENYCRVASRLWAAPPSKTNHLGFRIAR